MSIDLIKGNCLELMGGVADKSVQLICTDLPYGTTPLEFDKEIIPFEPLWKEYERIIKDDGAIVLFAQQPFTSKLIMSNLKLYKYNWVWVKDNATNFLNKRYQAGKITEDICVFGKGATSFCKGNVNMKYNPQMEEGKPYRITSSLHGRRNAVSRGELKDVETVNNGDRLPNNVLYFNRDKEKLHPTQKPLDLIRYLIRTYTDEGDLVLDSCFGSGTTAIACFAEKRNFIGYEINDEYFEIAKKRYEKESSDIFDL